MTVEAGATLQSVHEAAEAAGLLMPLDLGPCGSARSAAIPPPTPAACACSAGDDARHGAGSEAVLANGTVVSSLGKFIKDNAGYNWKHLLIGSGARSAS
jgi:FAD/FMN-containing dehydrogenase